MHCNPLGSSVHGIFPGKNTGVGCHFLLQGIFPTQGSNLCLLRLLHWQADSLPLVPPEKPQRYCCCCCRRVASVMSDSVRPHRRQPTRLPRPWDSPGKNTGVGCHFLLQCMKVKSESKAAQSCQTLSDHMDCSLPGSSVHGVLQARELEWAATAFSAAGLCLTAVLCRKASLRAGLCLTAVLWCKVSLKATSEKQVCPRRTL